MSIVSGYKKFKKYILTSSGFQLVSHWTKANTLEFDDGKTAQDKLGAIDGISSSRESNSDKIAASTALVSELNSDLSAADGEKFRYGKTADGKRGYIITNEAGADTVIPFSHSIKVIYNSSSYDSSYTFVEEGDYIISSCICKEGWAEKGDPIIELSVAEIYSNYQSTKYSGNNDETAIRFSYFHAKAGNTCRSYITGIDDTRHGYLTILKVG